jgi:hypothetical protein
MVVGGVSCRSSYAEEIHQRVAEIRHGCRDPDSIQWKHFHPGKFADYKKMVDFFLEANENQKLDFTAIVIDTRQLDHSKLNDGDGETFFQKIMYQVVRSRARHYDYPKSLRLFHGMRASSYDLREIKKIINAGISNERRDVIYRPLRQLDYMDPGVSGPHQLADTLLGAVSYYWNTGIRRGGQSRKRMLAEYINAECSADSLGRRTLPSKGHFNIWEFRLK